MTVQLRLLALSFTLSACLGFTCGLGSCGAALGYATELIPRAMADSGLNPRVSGTPRQVASVYFVSALILGLCAVPQWVAAFALFTRQRWTRGAALVGSLCALATCMPVGLYGFFVCARMARRSDPWASA